MRSHCIVMVLSVSRLFGLTPYEVCKLEFPTLVFCIFAAIVWDLLLFVLPSLFFAILVWCFPLVLSGVFLTLLV